MDRPIRPDTHVKHPYAYLIRSIALGIIILLSSVLSSSLLSFDWQNGVQQDQTVSAAGPDGPTMPTTTGTWIEYMESAFDSGNGSSGLPYIISTPGQLAYVAYQVNSGTKMDGYYRLAADIDLAGHEWIPIGYRSDGNSFKGKFLGYGFSISNLIQKSFSGIGYNGTAANVTGLFGNISGATIRDITLQNVYIIAEDKPRNDLTHHTASLVGYAQNISTIAMSHVVGAYIRSTAYYIGGLVGRLEKSTMEYSSFTTAITTSVTASGHSIINKYVANGYTGIKATSSLNCVYVGGLAGMVYGAGGNYGIDSSYMSCGMYVYKDNSSLYAGGLVGYLHSGHLYNSYILGTMWDLGNEQSEFAVFTGAVYNDRQQYVTSGYYCSRNYSTSFPTRMNDYMKFYEQDNYGKNIGDPFVAALYGQDNSSNTTDLTGYDCGYRDEYNCVFNQYGLRMALSFSSYTNDYQYSDVNYDECYSTSDSHVSSVGAYATQMYSSNTSEKTLFRYMRSSTTFNTGPRRPHNYMLSSDTVTDNVTGVKFSLTSYNDAGYVCCYDNAARDWWNNTHNIIHRYLIIGSSNLAFRYFNIKITNTDIVESTLSTSYSNASVYKLSDSSNRVVVYMGGLVKLTLKIKTGYADLYRLGLDYSIRSRYAYNYIFTGFIPYSEETSLTCSMSGCSYSRDSSYQSTYTYTAKAIYTLNLYRPNDGNDKEYDDNDQRGNYTSYGYLYYYNDTSKKFYEITGDDYTGPTRITDYESSGTLYYSTSRMENKDSQMNLSNVITSTTSTESSQKYFFHGLETRNGYDWNCANLNQGKFTFNNKDYGDLGTTSDDSMRLYVVKMSPITLSVVIDGKTVLSESSSASYSNSDGFSTYVGSSAAPVKWILDNYWDYYFDCPTVSITANVPSNEKYYVHSITSYFMNRWQKPSSDQPPDWDSSVSGEYTQWTTEWYTYNEYSVLNGALDVESGSTTFFNFSANDGSYGLGLHFEVCYYTKQYLFKIYPCQTQYGTIEYSVVANSSDTPSWSSVSWLYYQPAGRIVSVPLGARLNIRVVFTNGSEKVALARRSCLVTDASSIQANGVKINGSSYYAIDYWQSGEWRYRVSTLSSSYTDGVGPTYYYSSQNGRDCCNVSAAFKTLNRVNVSLTNNVAAGSYSSVLSATGYNSSGTEISIASAGYKTSVSKVFLAEAGYTVAWNTQTYSTTHCAYTATYNGKSIACNAQMSVVNGAALSVSCSTLSYTVNLSSPESDYQAVLWYKVYDREITNTVGAWTKVPAGTTVSVTCNAESWLYMIMLKSSVTQCTDSIFESNNESYIPNMKNVTDNGETYRFNSLSYAEASSPNSYHTFVNSYLSATIQRIIPAEEGRTYAGNFTKMYKQTYMQNPSNSDDYGDGDMKVTGTDGSTVMLYGSSWTCYAVSGSTVTLLNNTLTGGCMSTGTYNGSTLWTNQTTAQTKTATTTTTDATGIITYVRAPYTMSLNVNAEKEEYTDDKTDYSVYILYNGAKYYDGETVLVSSGNDAVIQIVYGDNRYRSHSIKNGTLTGTIDTGLTTSRNTGDIVLHYTGYSGATLEFSVQTSLYDWADYGEYLLSTSSASSAEPTLGGTTYTISNTNQYAVFRYRLSQNDSYYNGKTIQLANDLDVAAYYNSSRWNWFYATGMTFDGLGHIFYNVKDYEISDGGGWLYCIENTTIKNLIFRNYYAGAVRFVCQEAIGTSLISNVGVQSAIIDDSWLNVSDWTSYGRSLVECVSQSSIVENCFIYGNIITSTNSAYLVNENGGIVRNCYLAGNAQAFTRYNYSGATIQNCYAANSSTKASTFVLRNSGTITNCVTNCFTTPQTGVTIATQSQMLNAGVFSGWDFVNTWSFSGRGVTGAPTTTIFAGQPDSGYPILTGFAGNSTNTVAYRVNLNNANVTTTPDNGGYRYYIYGTIQATLGTAYKMNTGSTPTFTFGNYGSSPNLSVVFYRLVEGSTQKTTNGTAYTSYTSAANDYTIGGNIYITTYFDSYNVHFINNGPSGVISSSDGAVTLYYPNTLTKSITVNSSTYTGAVVGYIAATENSGTANGQVYDINGGTNSTYTKSNITATKVNDSAVNLNIGEKSAHSTSDITVASTAYLKVIVSNNYGYSSGLTATFYNATQDVGTKTLTTSLSTNENIFYINPSSWNTLTSTISATGSDGTNARRLESWSRTSGGVATRTVSITDFANDYTTRTIDGNAMTVTADLYTIPTTYNLVYASATFGVTLNVVKGNYTTAPTVTSVTASNSLQSSIASSTSTSNSNAIVTYTFNSVAVGLATSFVVRLNTNGNNFMLFVNDNNKSGVSTNTSYTYTTTVANGITINVYPIQMFTIGATTGTIDTNSAYTTSDTSDITVCTYNVERDKAYSSNYKSGNYYMYGAKLTVNDPTTSASGKYTRTSWGSGSGLSNTTNTRNLTSNVAIAPTYSVNTVTVQINRSNSEYAIPWLAISNINVTKPDNGNVYSYVASSNNNGYVVAIGKPQTNDNSNAMKSITLGGKYVLQLTGVPSLSDTNAGRVYTYTVSFGEKIVAYRADDMVDKWIESIVPLETATNPTVNVLATKFENITNGSTLVGIQNNASNDIQISTLIQVTYFPSFDITNGENRTNVSQWATANSSVGSVTTPFLYEFQGGNTSSFDTITAKTDGWATCTNNLCTTNNIVKVTYTPPTGFDFTNWSVAGTTVAVGEKKTITVTNGGKQDKITAKVVQSGSRYVLYYTLVDVSYTDESGVMIVPNGQYQFTANVKEKTYNATFNLTVNGATTYTTNPATVTVYEYRNNANYSRVVTLITSQKSYTVVAGYYAKYRMVYGQNTSQSASFRTPTFSSTNLNLTETTNLVVSENGGKDAISNHAGDGSITLDFTQTMKLNTYYNSIYVTSTYTDTSGLATPPTGASATSLTVNNAVVSEVMVGNTLRIVPSNTATGMYVNKIYVYSGSTLLGSSADKATSYSYTFNGNLYDDNINIYVEYKEYEYDVLWLIGTYDLGNGSSVVNRATASSGTSLVLDRFTLTVTTNDKNNSRFKIGYFGTLNASLVENPSSTSYMFRGFGLSTNMTTSTVTSSGSTYSVRATNSVFTGNVTVGAVLDRIYTVASPTVNTVRTTSTETSVGGTASMTSTADKVVTGTNYYKSGASIKFTSSANTGYNFTNWTINMAGSSDTKTTREASWTLKGNITTAVATFTEKVQKITVNSVASSTAVKGGQVTLYINGARIGTTTDSVTSVTGNVGYFSTVEINAVANENCRFVTWTYSSPFSGAKLDYTNPNIYIPPSGEYFTTDVTVTASWVTTRNVRMRAVVYSGSYAFDNGSAVTISPSGVVVADTGTNVTWTYNILDDDYRFVGYYVYSGSLPSGSVLPKNLSDCLGTGSSYTLSNITNHLELIAVFIKTYTVSITNSTEHGVSATSNNVTENSDGTWSVAYGETISFNLVEPRDSAYPYVNYRVNGFQSDKGHIQTWTVNNGSTNSTKSTSSFTINDDTAFTIAFVAVYFVPRADNIDRDQDTRIYTSNAPSMNIASPVVEGQTVTLTPMATPQGYRFVGWAYTVGSTGTVYQTIRSGSNGYTINSGTNVLSFVASSSTLNSNLTSVGQRYFHAMYVRVFSITIDVVEYGNSASSGFAYAGLNLNGRAYSTKVNIENIDYGTNYGDLIVNILPTASARIHSINGTTYATSYEVSKTLNIGQVMSDIEYTIYVIRTFLVVDEITANTTYITENCVVSPITSQSITMDTTGLSYNGGVYYDNGTTVSYTVTKTDGFEDPSQTLITSNISNIYTNGLTSGSFTLGTSGYNSNITSIVMSFTESVYVLTVDLMGFTTIEDGEEVNHTSDGVFTTITENSVNSVVTDSERVSHVVMGYFGQATIGYRLSENYRFDMWNVEGDVTATENANTLRLDDFRSNVTVNIATISTHSISVSTQATDGNNENRISYGYDDKTGLTATNTVDSGTLVTFTAEADTDEYRLSGWYVYVGEQRYAISTSLDPFDATVLYGIEFTLADHTITLVAGNLYEGVTMDKNIHIEAVYTRYVEVFVWQTECDRNYLTVYYIDENGETAYWDFSDFSSDKSMFVPYGTTVTVIAVNDDIMFNFLGWYMGTTSATQVNTLLSRDLEASTTVTADKTYLFALFERLYYVNADVDDVYGGTIALASDIAEIKNQYFREGTVITFTVSVNPNYRYVNTSFNGDGSIFETLTWSIVVGENTSGDYIAHFIRQIGVTITTDPQGLNNEVNIYIVELASDGSVLSTTRVMTSSTGTTQFTTDINTIIRVEAIAVTDYEYLGIYNGQALITTETYYDFTLLTDVTYTAKFVANGRMLVVNGLGTVVIGGVSYSTGTYEIVNRDTTATAIPLSHGGVNTYNVLLSVKSGTEDLEFSLNSFAVTQYMGSSEEEGTITVTFDAMTWSDSDKCSTTLSGTGTEIDPYLVRNGNDLGYISNMSLRSATWSQGKYFSVQNDIDLSGYYFMPIMSFSGIFDGNNYTISNLFVYANSAVVSDAGYTASAYRAAMFGSTGNNAVIRNLNVNGEVTYLDSYNTGMYMIGGLVAYAASYNIIYNVHSDIDVRVDSSEVFPANSRISSFIATASSVDILSCSNSGDIFVSLGNIENHWISISSMLAYVGVANIENTAVSGNVNVSANQNVTYGGYAGYLWASTVRFNNLMSDVKVNIENAKGARIGGIIGGSLHDSDTLVSNSVFNGSIATGTLSENQRLISGMVGHYESEPVVKNGYYISTVSATNDFGSSLSMNELKNKDSMNLDFGSAWNIDSTINNGYPYLKSLYLVSGVTGSDMTYSTANIRVGTATELINVAHNSSKLSSGTKIILTSDIDLGGYSWTGFDLNAGVTLEGQGFTIKNLTLYNGNSFITTNNGTISALRIAHAGVYVNPEDKTDIVSGVVVGTNNGTIERVVVDKGGILVYELEQANDRIIGGVVGINNGTVKNSGFKGFVTYKALGRYTETSTNKVVIGGVVGQVKKADSVYSVFAEGDTMVRLKTETEGVYNVTVGGVLGESDYALHDAYYYGDIVDDSIVKTVTVGAITGASASVAYAHVYFAEYSITKEDPATGVSDTPLIGKGTLSSINGVYRMESTGVSEDSNATIKTIQEMQTYDTYDTDGYDFTNVWSFDSVYPTLIHTRNVHYLDITIVDLGSGQSGGNVDGITYGELSGTVYVVHGSDFDINMRPYENYEVDYIKVDGVLVSASALAQLDTYARRYTYQNVIGDHDIEVRFKLESFVITSDVMPDNTYGTTSISGKVVGQNDLGQDKYEYGSVVTLVATPVSDTVFMYWEFGGYRLSSLNNDYTFSADGKTMSFTVDRYLSGNYTAVFEKTYVVSAEVEPIPSVADADEIASIEITTPVSIEPDRYLNGEEVTIVTTANYGFSFSKFVLNGVTEIANTNAVYSLSRANGVTTLKFTLSSAIAGNYVAVYERNPYTVTLNVDKGLSVQKVTTGGVEITLDENNQFTSYHKDKIEVSFSVNDRYRYMDYYTFNGEELGDIAVVTASKEYKYTSINVTLDTIIEIKSEQKLWTDAEVTDLGNFDSSGNGTSANPFVISTANQLGRFAMLVNSNATYTVGTEIKYYNSAYYILKSDSYTYSGGITIDLSDRFWVPVGTSDDPFNGYIVSTGVMDVTSRYAYIYGVYMDTSFEGVTYQKEAGFFGYTNVASIDGIKLMAPNVITSTNAGIFVYDGMRSIFSNCAVLDSDVDGAKPYAQGNRVGAFSWRIGFGTFAQCGSTADICLRTDGYGGFVIGSNNGSIVNCYYVGSVNALEGARNIRAIAFTIENKGQIQNSFAYVSAGAEVQRYSTVYNNMGTLTNIYTVHTSGVANYMDTNEYEDSIFSLTPTSAQDKENLSLLDFDSIWAIDKDVNNGYPFIKLATTTPNTTSMSVVDNVVTISTPIQLLTLARAIANSNYSYFGGVNINTSDYTIRLSQDIDMAGINMIPIGSNEIPFAATFEGSNYTIHNLFIDRLNSFSDYTALFGRVNGVVQNLNVTISSINGFNSTAGLVGISGTTSTIYRVRLLNESDGTVTRYGSIVGSSNVSGIITYGYGTLNYLGNEVNIMSGSDGRVGSGIHYLYTSVNGLYVNNIGVNYHSLIRYSFNNIVISNSYVNYKSCICSWAEITSSKKILYSVSNGSCSFQNVYASIKACSDYTTANNATFIGYLSSVFDNTGAETFVNEQSLMTLENTYPTFDFDSVWSKISGENDDMPILRGFYGHSIHITSNEGTDIGAVDTFTDILGNAYALHGENFDILVTPSENWHIAYVILDGITYLGDSVNAEVIVTNSVITIPSVVADHDVYIHFEIDHFDYTINGTLGSYLGDTLPGITLGGSGTYDYGSTVTLTVSFDMTVYREVRITKDDVEIDITDSKYGYTSGNGVVVLTMLSNKDTAGNYNVVFVRHYKLTLSVTVDEVGADGGTAVAVTTPNAYGQSINEYYFDEGTRVEILATAFEGMSFVGWTAGSVTISSANPYSFTISNTTNYLANFETIYYTVSVEALGNFPTYGSATFEVTNWKTGIVSSVVPDNDGNIRLAYGTKLVSTFDPDYRFLLQSLTLDSVEQTRSIGEDPSVITIEKLVSDMAITYTINKDTWNNHYSEIPASQISGDTYTIMTAEQFAWVLYKHRQSISWIVGKTFVFGADIDLDEYFWLPIAASYGEAIKEAVFDGNMHTISNVYMLSTSWATGMFGYLVDSTVKNLVFEDIHLEKTEELFAQIIVDSVVENCHILSGEIIDCWWANAFVSQNYGIIRNSTNYATITGFNAGGIARHNYGLIENCINYGTITSTNPENAQSNTTAITEIKGDPVYSITILDEDELYTVKSCMNYGTVTGGRENYVVYSSNPLAKVVNIINYGQVETVVGGSQVANGTTATKVINMYSNAAFGENVVFSLSYTAGATTATGVSTFMLASVYTADMFSDIVFGGEFVIYMGKDGLGTKTDANNNISHNKKYFTNYNDMLGTPILRECVTLGNWIDYRQAFDTGLTMNVTTAEQLSYIAYLVNNSNLSSMSSRTISIQNDLDLFGHYWTPIANRDTLHYTGGFEGNNYTINYMTMVANAVGENGLNNCIGLFGRIRNNSVFRNIDLANVYIDATNFFAVGSIVGFVTNDAYIENIDTLNGEIFYRKNSSVVDQNYAVGGVIGSINSFSVDVTLCHNSADIYVDIWSYSQVDSSVYTTRLVGGLIGRMWVGTSSVTGTISKCYNTGNITTINSAFTDGLVALGTGYTLKDCYNTGIVNSNRSSSAALASFATVINCYNVGFAQSFGGWNAAASSRNNYYLEGSVSVPRQSVSLTSEELKTFTSFDATWDFLNTWTFIEGENNGYPVLIDNYNYITTTVEVQNADMGMVNVSGYAHVVSNENLTITETTNSAKEIVWTFGVKMLVGTSREFTFSTSTNKTILRTLTYDGEDMSTTSPLEVTDTSKDHIVVARFEHNVFTLTLVGSITSSGDYTVQNGTKMVVYLTEMDTGRTFVILLSDGQTKVVHNLLIGTYTIRIGSKAFFESTITTANGVNDSVNLTYSQTVNLNINKWGDKWLNDSESTF